MPRPQTWPTDAEILEAAREAGRQAAQKGHAAQLKREEEELQARIRQPELHVRIRYRNHRGEVAARRILPLRLWHGSTEWHPEAQYLVHAYDLDKGVLRDFALRDVLAWDVGEDGDGA